MLNNHSYYSFNYGVLSLESWTEWASEQGLQSLVLTDINHTAGMLDFVRLAQAQGLKAIAGADLRNDQATDYILIARNNAGFAALNAFISRHQMSGAPIPERPEVADCFTIYPFESYRGWPLAEHEFIGLRPSQRNRFPFSAYRDKAHKLLPLQTMSFRHKKDFNTHRLLRAIGENSLLSKLPKAAQGEAQDLLTAPGVLKSAFRDFPAAWGNMSHILAQSGLDFEFKNYHKSANRLTYLDSHQADREKIEQLCREGLVYRYGKPSAEVEARLRKELEVIGQRQYYSYFLINWDIVNYARRQNYYYVGRGSGANSLVAYLLRITDVDPIELDLYFERFINLSRRQPPDFDVDFSWRDRQDVTRYIFERFPKAALLGSQTTFQYRAVVRELGKVLGLPARDIEELSNPRTRPDHLDEMQRLTLKYGKQIENLPNKPTIHSSGILIPEREIYHFGSCWLPPKGFRTTHFDMYVAEDVGLYKFDILGQRGLGKIKDAARLVQENQPEAPEIDVHNPQPFYRDQKIRQMLIEGRTMACFYVESPAMRALLKKLRCDDYITLVAASSIIRPGVSKSGMMAEYIKRYREPEARQYIHPKMEEILGETFGVMVYQEDVLKVAHYFAGLTLEEADVLRRGMSWKFRERNEFHTIKDKFFRNCAERGYSAEITAEVWRQIESFGNYAFAKGHSASYAVESYQSLYFKAHYPLEYMVATVNNGGGFYSVETYLNEARLHGGVVEPPCVNQSDWETNLRGRRVILGFQHVKGLEEVTVEALLKERRQNGRFRDLGDLLDLLEISLEQLILLIRIRALRSFGLSKKELLWEAHFRFGKAKKSRPLPGLFRTENPDLALPELETNPLEDPVDEIEILGFPLSSPFRLVPDLPEGCVMAHELPNRVGQKVRLCGYLIHVKNVTTRGKQARHMQFGTFLDESGDFIDSVHFPPIAARYPFKGKGIYLIEGRVIEDYDFVSLECSYLERLPYRKFEEL